MHVEIVSKFEDGIAYTQPVSSNRNREIPTSDLKVVSFGPCHSTKAGTGEEVLFLKGDLPWCVDFPMRMSPTKHDLAIIRALDVIPDPVLISMAHYVPNARFPNLAPMKSIDSIQESAFIVEKLSAIGKKFAILVIVNDIKIDGTERRDLYAEYSLPNNLADSIAGLEAHSKTDIRVVVVSESKLVERLGRDWKKMRKSVCHGTLYDERYLTMKSLFGENGNHLAKCIRGFARLPGLPREIGFSSFIQVMPRCAVFNAHQGYHQGTKIYNDVPSILLYRTHKCW